MLSKITIKNFKSFRNKTIIDLNATKSEILDDTNKNSNNILKGALFIGGNASGKTTIIEAGRFLLELLVWQVEVELVLYKSLYSDVKELMELEYEFNIENSKIVYKIETDNARILSETLIQDNRIVYSRTNNTGEYIDVQNKKIKLDNLQRNQSGLRKIYFDTKFIDNPKLIKWYEFLKNSVYMDQSKKLIFSANRDKYNDVFFENGGIEETNEFLKKINYDQHIDYVSEYKNKSMQFNFNEKKKGVIFIREDFDLGLPLDMESEGNKTLAVILPQILQASKNDCMILIDEFSSSLHNVLEEEIIRYFMKTVKNSQIFVVSHSTNLLTNTLLRPDQIYTIEYKKNIGSIINRVSDSNPREAQNLEKMYLSGVFNGIPRID